MGILVASVSKGDMIEAFGCINHIVLPRIRQSGQKMSISNGEQDPKFVASRLGDREAAVKLAQPGHDAAAFLAAIVESSDDAIVSKSLGGVITTWNKGAERLFGYTAEEAIGRPIKIVIPEDRLDEEPAILARIRAGNASSGEEPLCHNKQHHWPRSQVGANAGRSCLTHEGPVDGAVAGARDDATDIEPKRQRRRQPHHTV